MNEYVCKDVLRQVLEERFFKYIADEIMEDLPTADGVIVLPCKVGTAIYCINWRDEIASGKITMIQQKADGTWKFRITTSYSHDVTIDAIGKTVFLSREEAEAALEKMKGE